MASPPAGPLWDEWCQRASASQRQQVVDRAASEGLVYAHQLPRPEGGPGTSLPDRLDALLQGETTAVVAPPLPSTDAALDANQREAVARALATPDVALILGPPGSGKSRTVTELLRQVLAAGRRVLFTAASASAVDRALAPLAAEPNQNAVRVPAPREVVGQILPAVARLCPAEQARHCRESSLPAARTALDQALAALELFDRQAEAWPRLAEWASWSLAGESARADRQLPAGSAEGPPFPLSDAPASLLALATRRDEAAQRVTSLDAERSALLAEEGPEAHEQQQLEALASLLAHGRWWSLAYWRARSQSDPRPRLEELLRRRQVRQEQLVVLEAKRAEAVAERDRLGEQGEKERAAWEQEVVARRRQEAEAQTTARRQQQELAAGAWATAVELLGAAAPTEPSVQAIEVARQAWAEQQTRARAAAEAARAWLEELERAVPTLELHLIEGAQLVAGPLPALVNEQGALAPFLSAFDLLVVEEAHFVREADLRLLASRAKRCALVGEPAPDLPLAPPPRGTTRSVPQSLFHRLWGQLHSAPQRSGARWRYRGGRLVCALRQVYPHSGPLHREPVFDRPEIELSILAPPGQGPQIVEVSFPAGTTPADAKRYLAAELQEIAVEAAGSTMQWLEGPESITLELGGPGTADRAQTVVLEDGVVEALAASAAGLPALTRAVTFERARGWDRQRAGEWVAEKLGWRDLGRTAVLAKAYRARAALVHWLAELLPGGMGEPASEPMGAALPGQAIELISVTAARREQAGARGGRPLRAGGAGLEVDLGAPRGEGLPADLRHALPQRGVVNLTEARAVVQALESLVCDSSFRAASVAWQQRDNGRCCAAGVACPSVAVVALLPEQAELLRLLISRSTVVGHSGVSVEVGTPLQLAQRECLVALVSLTRSHTHRAVPFTEHPDDLVLAVTRPAGRLVLFGDPGTMARRAQWNGALDHLDEVTGPLEQALVGQLIARWPEAEPAARAPRPRESSSV